MKTIKEIYNIVIESLITEKLLNRDIEQRIKTDKSYNPIALDFYKFLKTKNVTYQFYHGTSGVAWEMMKKDGYITSPFLRGTGEFEARKGSSVKEKGINQVYFTTNYDISKQYADRECKKFKDVENFKDFINIAKSKYNFSDEFIEENNTPIILKITIPLYLLTEVVQCIYSEDYRNESGIAKKIAIIVLNEKKNNKKKLKELIEYIDNTKNRNNEFTVIGLLPVSRVKGFEMVRTLTKNEEEIFKYSKLLINVAYNGDLEKVKEYIEKGADIHTRNDGALRGAAENGHLEVVKYLVENGADIHANYDEALRDAAGRGYLEIVKYLIQNGAKIKSLSDSALIRAIIGGHLEIIKYLLENGAKVNARNNEALKNSIFPGRLDIIKCLVENGANVNADNDYALRVAAHKGYLEIVKYLIEKGANIHAKNDAALKFAVMNGQLEVVKYLLEKGADISKIKDRYITDSDIEKFIKQKQEELKNK